MSNSWIFAMQSCDTANVMASPCQPGSTSPCDQRKRRWCPRNANVTANVQYRQKVPVTWYDITAYRSRGIHVMWWLSTTHKATKETSADWGEATGPIYIACQPLHVSKRFTWCTRVGWYDFTVGSSRNHESTTTTSKTICRYITFYRRDVQWKAWTLADESSFSASNAVFFSSTPAKFAFNCQVNREEIIAMKWEDRKRLLLVRFSLPLLSWLRELPGVRPRKKTDR